MITDFKTPKIPSRPQWTLSDKEKLVLEASLFLKASDADLYSAFVEPTAPPRRAKAMAEQLFTSPDAKEYLEMLKSTLNRSWFGVQSPKEIESKEEKIARAKEVVEDMIIAKAQDPNEEDLSKYIDRFYKIFGGDEENGEEPPRRYLPQVCGTVIPDEVQNDGKCCRYKYFCETNCEDECQICRYRDYAITNGCKEFDYRNQLDTNLKDKTKIIKNKVDNNDIF